MIRTDLSGKVAVVTGSTRGIGRAIALRLAEHGADVAINGRSAGREGEVLAAVERLGRRAMFVQADIGQWSEVSAMMEEANRQLGRIDILAVGGGGGASHGPRLFSETAPESFLDHVQGQFLSRLYCARAALPYMRATGKGKIVFITTDAGRVPTVAESLIGGSAAGLIFATRVLGRELSRWQIRVNAIAITLTKDTASWERHQARLAADPEQPIVKVFQKLESRAPFGLNHPEDIADTALFLLSDASDQISGATISVNGGTSFP